MSQPISDATGNTAPPVLERRVIDEIARALAGLRYGSLEITVHDGRITQIESKKKIRLS